MNRETVLMITGATCTGKSAMAAKFQSIGEVLDLDYLTTYCGKRLVVLPELFDLALTRGCRIFSGTCDNWAELLGLIKRAKMQPLVFVLTPTESQGGYFMRRKRIHSTSGATHQRWLRDASEHVARVRQICQEQKLTCFQLQRTSDGESVLEVSPGVARCELSISYFAVPEFLRYSEQPDEAESAGLLSEFRSFMKKHWRDISTLNAMRVNAPLDLWAQVRGFKALQKRVLTQRTRTNAASTSAWEEPS